MNFAGRIYRFADELPKSRWELADQFKHAAMSISLILAENNEGWYPNERKDFFLMTRGSAVECIPLLDLCRRQKLIDETECVRLKGELVILARMLTRLLRETEEEREQ